MSALHRDASSQEQQSCSAGIQYVFKCVHQDLQHHGSIGEKTTQKLMDRNDIHMRFTCQTL